MEFPSSLQATWTDGRLEQKWFPKRAIAHISRPARKSIAFSMMQSWQSSVIGTGDGKLTRLPDFLVYLCLN